MRQYVLINVILLSLFSGVAPTSASTDSPQYSLDNVEYWTSSSSTVPMACNPNEPATQLCISEVFLGDRKLILDTANQSTRHNRVNLYQSLSTFNCWSPTWPQPSSFTAPKENEKCVYVSYTFTFFDHGVRLENPTTPITVKFRKMASSHPATNVGFLSSIGPVKEFIPASTSSEMGSATILPGLTYSYPGSHFNAFVHTLTINERELSPPRWEYGLFLATGRTAQYTNTGGFEIIPESHGTWQATNSQYWGFYGDYWKPDYAIRVAGPHFHYKENANDPDVLNTSWFTTFLPRAFIARQFGLTPENANETNIAVMRSVGKNPTQLPSVFTPQPDGLIIETTGITFSKPVIAVTRKLQLKKNQSLSTKKIIAAAGIPVKDRKTAQITKHPCRKWRNNCVASRTRFSFTSKGRYTFSISYTTLDSRKRQVRQTNEVTVRVR